MNRNMNKLLVALVAGSIAFGAQANNRVDNAAEAVSQGAKSVESAAKSKTADNEVERFVQDKRSDLHKEKAKSAAKKATN